MEMDELESEILSEIQIEELENQFKTKIEEYEKQVQYLKDKYHEIDEKCDDLENENSYQKERLYELEEYTPNVKTVDDEFRAKICLKLYNNIELEQLQELEIKFNLRFKK